MSKKIQKLNRLINAESFIQVNPVKGYEYIDKTGRLINIFHKNKIPPNFTANINGLVIRQPDEKIDTIKVSSNMFWIRFMNIDSLDMISSIYAKKCTEVLESLNVKKVSRIGWRNHFIYEFSNEQAFNEYFEKLNPVEGFLNSIIIEVTVTEKVKVNLSIQPVLKTDGKTFAVMFDADIFSEEEFSIADVEPKLKEFLKYLKDSNEFIRVINKTFK